MQALRTTPARFAAPGRAARVSVVRTTGSRRSVTVQANGNGLPIDLRGEQQGGRRGKGWGNDNARFAVCMRLQTPPPAF